jgi:hypothetical protein
MMEGKPIGGVNSDVENVIHDTSSVVSSDINEDCITKDFTCNTIFYDPQNDIFVDPTGWGIHDAVKKLLRIPAEENNWELWVKGNSFKILRYWVMRMNGYQPVDNKTEDFIVKHAISEMDTLSEDSIQTFIKKGVMRGKTDSRSQQALKRFKTLVVQGMITYILKLT